MKVSQEYIVELNKYLLQLAEREGKSISEISRPSAALSRMFNEDKQREAVEQSRCHKERVSLILEIQEHINSNLNNK